MQQEHLPESKRTKRNFYDEFISENPHFLANITDELFRERQKRGKCKDFSKYPDTEDYYEQCPFAYGLLCKLGWTPGREIFRRSDPGPAYRPLGSVMMEKNPYRFIRMLGD